MTQQISSGNMSKYVDIVFDVFDMLIFILMN
jgi:hypothetical protein